MAVSGNPKQQQQLDDSGGVSAGSKSSQGNTSPIRADVSMLLGKLGADRLAASIQSLAKERDVIAKQKKTITKTLKNARRQRLRLKTKAKMLSTTDIVDVLTMRKEAEKKAREKKASEK